MISHKSHTSYLDHMIQHLVMESSSKLFLSCDRSSVLFVLLLFFSSKFIFFFKYFTQRCSMLYSVCFSIFHVLKSGGFFVFVFFPTFQVIYVTAIDFHISVALVDLCS